MVIVEEESVHEAEEKIAQIISETRANDVWLKSDSKEMSNEEIEEFFDKTKEEMLRGSKI